jgi:nucleotide-binding universal stress UspA family protein
MKILVAYDGSPSADAALDDLQRAGLPADSDVLLITVATGPDPKHFTEACNLAEAATDRLLSLFPQGTVRFDCPAGLPSDVLLQTTHRWQPDLVVMGSHGRSPLGRLVMGSASRAMVHQAPCSVRIVRAGAAPRSGPVRLVVGTDGSPHAVAAIREIARRNWPAGTEVRVVAVVETLVPALTAIDTNTYASESAFQIVQESDRHEWDRKRAAAEESEQLLRDAGLTASSIVQESDPRRAIVEEAEAWSADAVFVGARGLGFVDRLVLGSVSDAVVSHSTIPVEIVRTPKGGTNESA